MVFESRTGDTIILGATTWRIDQITHDRVTVTPAPGEPGKMPFWHGDSAGRPAEFGREIGEMTRELLATPRAAAFTRLVEEHSLDANAAENLLRYLEDQTAATGRVPSDRDIVIERCRDELGDFRVCVLTPFGSRVHAGIFISVVMAVIVWAILKYTPWGFRLRVVGGNAEAARRAGFKVGAITITAMLFGGALAGLAGMIELSGVETQLRVGMMSRSCSRLKSTR